MCVCGAYIRTRGVQKARNTGLKQLRMELFFNCVEHRPFGVKNKTKRQWMSIVLLCLGLMQSRKQIVKSTSSVECFSLSRIDWSTHCAYHADRELELPTISCRVFRVPVKCRRRQTAVLSVFIVSCHRLILRSIKPRYEFTETDADVALRVKIDLQAS